MTQVKIRKNSKQLVFNVDINQRDDTFYVKTYYHADLVEEFKQFEKSRWDKEHKCYVIPATERNVFALQRLQDGVTYSDLQKRFLKFTPEMLEVTRPLFKHQLEGLAFVLSRQRCLLAFEMGLGKTLICIEVMERYPDYTWWLVAPPGAQLEWKRQLLRWRAQVKPTIITTYESIQKYLNAEIPDGIILDESIKIKNPYSQRSKNIYTLCKAIRQAKPKDNFIIFLNGAPAPKDPSDWWHQIESWKEDELQRLGQRLSPLVFVKKKTDCFDLPDKIFDVVECETSEKEKQTINLVMNTAESAIDSLTKLRELSDGFLYEHTAEGRTYKWMGSNKINIIEGLLDLYNTDNNGPGRLIIYAVFNATVDELFKFVQSKGWACDKVDGRGWSNKNAFDIFNDKPEIQNYCI